MEEVNIYLKFGTAENLSLIAIILSVIFSIITLVLNRREPPNIMPYNKKSPSGRLELFFINTSGINIKNLTILINGFGMKDLGEIKPLFQSDKYFFTIGEKTVFSYSFPLGNWAKKGFYFRVRFCGEYNTKYFITRKFKQHIWYSFTPEKTDGDRIEFQLHSTHKDDIDKLEAKNEDSLKGYEKITDRKFKK